MLILNLGFDENKSEILVERHDFSEERVQKQINRLKDLKNKTNKKFR